MAEALADAHRGGWRIVRGWAAPLGTERLVCTGRVRTSDDARRSLLAAISGAGLIVHVCGDREIVDRFVDELRSLGHVEHLVTGRPEGEVAAAPHPVQPP